MLEDYTRKTVSARHRNAAQMGLILVDTKTNSEKRTVEFTHRRNPHTRLITLFLRKGYENGCSQRTTKTTFKGICATVAHRKRFQGKEGQTVPL
jgi:hypothetical protein